MPVSHITAIKPEQQTRLLELAMASIHQGLRTGTPLFAEPNEFAPELAQPAASFVTLNLQGELRGCIGTIKAYQPLVDDVTLHAFDAAFHDPRFSPVTHKEIHLLDVHISVLSEPQPLPQGISEEHLLATLKPHHHGLILQQGRQQALFLPQVWRQLPEPQQFLTHLKRKGGWSTDSPIAAMNCSLFEVQEFWSS